MLCLESLEDRTLPSSSPITATALNISAIAGTAAVHFPANNGFEAPDLLDGYSYSTPDTGWTMSSGLAVGVPGESDGGGVGIAANNSAFIVQNASNGNSNGITSTLGQAAFIQGGDGTLTGNVISQTLHGFGAGTASVSFSIETRAYGDQNNPIDVKLDDQDLGTYQADSTDNFNSIVTASVPVTAGSHTLYFIGTNPTGDDTQFIDNVSVTNALSVATFSDADPAKTASDFTATIQWGDVNTSTGSVGALGSGQFGVSGTHSYAEAGTYQITVTISDNAGNSTTVSGTATVAVSPITATGLNITAVEGAGGVLLPANPVATFTDTDPAKTASDFAATIQWGDGNTSTGTITALGNSQFSVSGAHTYVEEGTYQIAVTITDDAGRSRTVTGTATVADAPLQNAVAGVLTVFNTGVDASGALLPDGSVDPHYQLIASTDPFNPGPASAVVLNNGFPLPDPWIPDGPNSAWIAPQADQYSYDPDSVGGSFDFRTTFDLTGFDANTAQLTGQFSADNEVFDVLLNGQSTGINNLDPYGWSYWSPFTISSGFHPGVNTLVFQTHNDGGPTGFRAEISGTAQIAIKSMQGIPFSNLQLAAFTDANPFGTAADFTATIDWGDGTPSSSGSIRKAGTTFVVTGSHAYNTPGSRTVTVMIADDGGQMTTASLPVTTVQSIYVLNGTAMGALTLSGDARINVSGSVVVDSSSTAAISASGNARLRASEIDVLGGVQKKGHAALSVTPTTGVSLPDPLAGLMAPDPHSLGLSDQGSVKVTKGSHTISQGIYSRIRVSGSGRLSLNPGIYIIKGGGLTVSGSASLRGENVLIYIAGSEFPASGGECGGISLSGEATVKLTAASSGPYAGVVFYQARDNTRTIDLDGNVSAVIHGAIYAANAQLSMSGDAQLQAALVVGTLSLSGEARLTGSMDPTNPSRLDDREDCSAARDDFFAHHQDQDDWLDELALAMSW